MGVIAKTRHAPLFMAGLICGAAIGGAGVWLVADRSAVDEYPIDMPIEETAERKEELWRVSMATEALVSMVLRNYRTGDSEHAAEVRAQTALMIAKGIGDADKRVFMMPITLGFSASTDRCATVRAFSLFAWEIYIELVAYEGLVMLTHSVPREDNESLREVKREQVQVILYGDELPDGLAEMSDAEWADHCKAEIHHRQRLLTRASVRHIDSN